MMSVVVGVDGSVSCLKAIRLAAQEARYRGTALIAVMAYSSDRAVRSPSGQSLNAVQTGGDERSMAESSLRHAVCEALGNQADDVELRVLAGTAGRQIIEAARDVGAQLIVLTVRGSVSQLVGTVSQYVLHKATCPVLVVPA
jgi:nucleotide-binding universal stress UspA family protein